MKEDCEEKLQPFNADWITRTAKNQFWHTTLLDISEFWIIASTFQSLDTISRSLINVQTVLTKFSLIWSYKSATREILKFPMLSLLEYRNSGI